MDIPELLKTKLLVPPVRRDLMERPRLFALLDEGLSRRLALVSAPAGYGKTTLVSGWARQRGLPVAWLSLDEGDNDPARFLGHLCACFETVAPSLASSLLELVQADRFGGLGAACSVEAVQTGLLNRLQSVSQPLVLILDDFHLITARPIHRLVAFLVDNLPLQLHLVITSRSDPPLPLARLRARGELLEVRQGDLRFTPDEATALLNQVMGLRVEAGDITALASRTEGWIAGIQLAATSMRSHGDVHRFIQDFRGSNRYVLDYLVEEVLQRQSQEVQDFLRETSLLDRLTGPLCDAVTGQSGGQGVLEMLERANLFIVPLDDERRWYRYHRLFADLLRKRLGESGPERVAVLHRRASGWYEQNGLPAEAIDHALAAKDFDRAVQLVERVAETTLLRGEATTLLRWLDALPESQVQARPSLCVYHAWVLLLGGASLEEVETRLLAVAGLPASLTLPLRAWVSLYRGDLSGSIEEARHALEQLPEHEVLLRGLAVVGLAAAYHANGDLAASRQVLRQALPVDHRTGNLMTALYAAWYQAESRRREGDLPDARSLFLHALDLATDGSGNLLPIAGQLLSGLGEIAREWNELDTAAQYILEAIALAERWTQAGTLDSYLTLARIRQARGDWGGVYEALQTMRQVATRLNAMDIVVRMVDAVEVWMQIVESRRSGRSGQALAGPRRWAERYGLDGDVDPLALQKTESVIDRRFRKYEYPVAARLRRAEGRPAEAMQLLESALPIVEELNRVGMVIEYELLIALAAQELGQSDRAMRSLERALALAEPGGFVRVFVDEGEPMAHLLHEAASQGVRPEYVGRLLAAFPGYQPSALSYQQGDDTHHSSPVTHHSSGLSERELEVLRLVADGRSNDEIARSLVVSLPTVKFHTSNIYHKLNTRNRTEAVARARGLGLLPLSPVSSSH